METTAPIPIDLTRLPKKNQDVHIWVDYVELLCLFNIDGIVTKAEVVDRLQENEYLLDSADEDTVGFADDATVSETKDKEETQIDDWFLHLSYRTGALDTFYPFILSKNGDSLALVNDLTLKHKLYIFLLAASNLRYFPKYVYKITNAFERMSLVALKEMLPHSAQVHLFRPSGDVVNRHYQGNVWSRINNLAEDLRERVLVNEDHFSPSNSGDEGLDLVGWVPVGDETTGGMLSIFGQCACTEEWVTKQHSSSMDSWRSKITFTSPAANMIFIPFCFRTATGEWCQPKDIHQSILIDRVRLAYFLSDEYVTLQQLPVFEVIEEFLTIKESLV